MGRVVTFKNTWGSQNSRLDQQRLDLFKFSIALPDFLGLSWYDTVEFAVFKFPFPQRAVESIPTKYMQQTNFQIGGDVPLDPVEISVRYAFAQRTGEALEKWFQLISNMRTGGVALTSAVKSKGYMRWQVPNMARQIADLQRNAQPGEDTMNDGLVYELEGCYPKALKQTDADMEVANQHAHYLLTLQIDRYYPVDLDTMPVVVTF